MERPAAVWSDLGLMEYERSLSLQRELGARAREDGGVGTALFVEHPHTITLGYSLRGDEGRASLRVTAQELSALGVRVVEVDRGGKATYHGPGQLVCYPVFDLKVLRLGVKRWVGRLMDLVVGALQDLGVDAELDDDYPGVWVGGAKLAAVGVRVADRISYHGFAVNVDPDLSMFGHIVPCGLADRPVTSLAELGGKELGRGDLIVALLARMERELGIELIERAPGVLLGGLEREAG